MTRCTQRILCLTLFSAATSTALAGSALLELKDGSLVPARFAGEPCDFVLTEPFSWERKQQTKYAGALHITPVRDIRAIRSDGVTFTVERVSGQVVSGLLVTQGAIKAPGPVPAMRFREEVRDGIADFVGEPDDSRQCHGYINVFRTRVFDVPVGEVRGITFYAADSGADQAVRARAEQVQKAIEMRERNAAVFRKKLAAGNQSHCGLVVSVNGKGGIAQIQTPVGLIWLPIGQLYQAGSMECRFVNGVYQDPGPASPPQR